MAGIRYGNMKLLTVTGALALFHVAFLKLKIVIG